MSLLTPILLAAGTSSRMGRPKALLDFDGQAALEIALEAVAGHGIPVVVLGPNHREIEDALRLRERQVQGALNLDPSGGQTLSLKRGLALLPPHSEAFFFMPADFPLVSAAEVARLTLAFRSNADPGRSIFIPSHRMKRGHPVLCRRELADEFLALPQGASAREVLNRDPGRIAYVEYPEAYVLMDMDTPEDYVRCLEAYRSRKSRNA